MGETDNLRTHNMKGTVENPMTDIICCENTTLNSGQFHLAESDVVCFGMATDLPVTLGCPSQYQDRESIDVLYDPSESLVLTKSHRATIGQVNDSNTRQLLSVLHQESELEFQFRVIVEHTTSRKYAMRSHAANVSKIFIRLMVIVYGPMHLFEDVGEFFQTNDCYLQEPRDCDRNVRYRNPHCIAGLDDDAPLTFALERGQVDCEQVSTPRDLLTGLETDELLPEAQDPPGLITPLYKHQRQALSFMQRREKGWALRVPASDIWSVEESKTGTREYVNNVTGDRQCNAPPGFQGGILADDMGLGKTLTMIALIASDRRWKEVNTQMDSISSSLLSERASSSIWKSSLITPSDARELKSTTATLLVVPSSVLQQWQTELRLHLHTKGRDAVRWTIHHGTCKLQSRKQIEKYAIIMTSFQTLASEYRKHCKNPSVLFTTFWHRIVLDEAHSIRNRHTITACAVFDLEGASRWAITGTPVQNRLSDFTSLLQFLRPYPYCNRKTFEEDIVDVWKLEDENIAFERLRRLFKFVSIRRSKAVLNLPEKTDVIRYLRFNAVESTAYQNLEIPIADMIDTELENEELNCRNYMQALVKINVLRKFCNLGLSAQELSTSNESSRATDKDQWSSSMARAILEDLLSSGQAACSICNSDIQWTVEPDPAMIESASRAMLNQASIKFVRIDGKVSTKNRELALKTFENDPSLHVMLLSIFCGAEGWVPFNPLRLTGFQR
ncbi:hypothetical protein Asppvi_008494 [Aspergillus pseudoviridinutans]|uniref:Helicase ATP-binding domain-containing protein n=1 Tax=Aspergillus pseudoviridinutans TaxID=1517512 RepID=A0A9P3BDS9_9EURO|nr:uncharacterized protein Asppvi_008494 [Aspergillus pseudoviridinutans]GIJ89552.1 hypothetical protein Asppvi_008494 [Aspergillus pseudoviridinutans]